MRLYCARTQTSRYCGVKKLTRVSKSSINVIKSTVWVTEAVQAPRIDSRPFTEVTFTRIKPCCLIARFACSTVHKGETRATFQLQTKLFFYGPSRAKLCRCLQFVQRIFIFFHRFYDAHSSSIISACLFNYAS